MRGWFFFFFRRNHCKLKRRTKRFRIPTHIKIRVEWYVNKSLYRFLITLLFNFKRKQKHFNGKCIIYKRFAVINMFPNFSASKTIWNRKIFHRGCTFNFAISFKFSFCVATSYYYYYTYMRIETFSKACTPTTFFP